MSTNALAGLSLNAILGTSHKPPPQPDQAQAQAQPEQQPPPPPKPPGRRTLIDIIKEEEPSKERRTWEYFRKTLLLKRAGEAWSSAVPQGGTGSHSGTRSRSNFRSNSGEANRMVETMPLSDPYFKRGRSGRNKIMEVEEDHDGAEIRKSTDSGSMRLMSAREAVVAQQAAEAAKAEAVKTSTVDEEEEEEEEEENKQPSMSLGDLMGGYGMEEEEEEEDEEDDDEAEAEADDGGIEHTCCVCMVRHKGAAFIPCGHTFCRLCSRELMVQRGNCPICNNFILEVLEIF